LHSSIRFILFVSQHRQFRCELLCIERLPSVIRRVAEVVEYRALSRVLGWAPFARRARCRHGVARARDCAVCGAVVPPVPHSFTPRHHRAVDARVDATATIDN
jgi:hypothetical protein